MYAGGGPADAGGLIFLFPLAPAFGVAGGILGASFGAAADLGIKDDVKQRVQELVQPGTSALLIILRKVTPDKFIEPPGPARLNAGRLWAGGVATAIVAALVVVAGVYIARGILGIPVLAPRAAGSLGSSTTAVYTAVAAPFGQPGPLASKVFTA
jgi:Protein of unknown function (DUF1269)